MTAVWGPLGWMTLHSVATLYPESPTPSERDLVYSWLDMFRDTITCPHCKDHFTSMLANYRATFPNMLNSRQELAMFSFRAHNAVNRRLRKPIQGSVEECMATLQNNLKTRSARDYRFAYVNHIMRYWSTQRDVNGMVATKKIYQMQKIENEYFTPRDTNFNVSLRSDSVLLPRDVLEKDPSETLAARPISIQPTAIGSGFRLTSTGIRIRR